VKYSQPNFYADLNLVRWDTWKAFHLVVGGYGFTRFDTGELVCTRTYNHDPDQRRFYPELNLIVWGTNDDWPRQLSGYKLFTPDGRPVTKGSLNDGGQQVLIIDPDKEVAISVCERGFQNTTLGLPARFRDSRAMAYWPGELCEPVGCEIRIRTYIKANDPLVERAKDIKAQCDMWFEMEKSAGSLERRVYTEIYRPTPVGNMLDFVDMLDIQRVAVAKAGYVIEPTDTMYSKLKVHKV